MENNAWREQLIAYRHTCRAALPLPFREVLSTEEEARCQILGGSLIGWLQEEFPQIIRQQQALRLRRADDPLPLVVITTEMAGLVAAEEIIGDSDKIIYMLSDEYNRWENKHLDDGYAWHVDYWSAFHQVSDEDWTQLITEGINNVEHANARWHIVGCLWGAQVGNEATHLWEWIGNELSLVAPGYREVIF